MPTHTPTGETGLLDRMAPLGDPVRARLLLILESRELTVSELCEVVRLPQSTVSRHLRALTDAGWIAARKDGTSRWYSFADDGLTEPARRLWDVVRDEVAATEAAANDRERVAVVLAVRRERSRAFFESEASGWDSVRDELFGADCFLRAVPALLDASWTIGDLGCGTGRFTEALAPFVRRVVAVDDSETMLAAARERLHDRDNVDLRRGEIESLPIDDAELDAATLVLVLHHVVDPARALAEVARAVKPGGRALVVDMTPHDRQDLRERMGHVWLGFSDRAIARAFDTAGFVEPRFVELGRDPRARGPSLFVATARRPN